MRIADKYVTRELVPPFILGVGGFLVILIGDILYTLAEYIALGRVTMDTVLRLLAYKMPAIMVVTFPVSTLFGTLIGMSRLARDREIQAMRLAGTAVSRVFLPVVIFGLVVTAGTFMTNEVVAPWANHNANLVIRRALFGEAFPEVREQVFLRAPGNRFLYIHTVDDRARVLRNVMISEANRTLPRLITARLGLRQLGEPVADRGKGAGIGRRIRTRCAPDRALVDVDDLVEIFQAFDTVVRRRMLAALVELARSGLEQSLDGQGRLAAA